MTNHIITKAITAEDVAELESQDQRREIIDGKWGEGSEMAGKLHGRIVKRLIRELDPFVEDNNLGEIYPDGTTYVLEGTRNRIITMRIPDVSFVARDRVDTDDPGYYYLAPDLAIEVLSPSETNQDTSGKIADYLRFGTQQVWVLDPEQKTLTVHFPDRTTAAYSENVTVPGGDVLPGFELKLAGIFG